MNKITIVVIQGTNRRVDASDIDKLPGNTVLEVKHIDDSELVNYESLDYPEENVPELEYLQ